MFRTLLFVGFLSISWVQATAQDGQSFKCTNLAEGLKQINQQFDSSVSYDAALAKKVYWKKSYSASTFALAIEHLLLGSRLSLQNVGKGAYFIQFPPEEVFIYEIKNQEHKEQLPAASIILKSGEVIVSDEAGKFSLDYSQQMAESFEVRYTAHQPKVVSVQPKKSRQTIYLSIDTEVLPDVILRSFLVPGLHVSKSGKRKVLKPNSKQVLAGSTDRDVFYSLQQIPAIQSLDGTATNLYIKGGAPDQNLILWDDIPVYQAGNLFGMTSAFNADVIDQVDIQSSGFGAEYGGRISSIVQMKALEKVPKTSIAFSTDGLQSAVGIKAPILDNKLGLLISGRNSLFDFMPDQVLTKYVQKIFQHTRIDADENEIVSNFEEEQKLHFSDYQAKLLWQKDSTFQISVAGFTSKNKFDFLSSTGEVDYLSDWWGINDFLNQNAQAWNAKMAWQFHPKHQLTALYWDSRQKYTSETEVLDESFLTNGDITTIDRRNLLNDRSFKLQWKGQILPSVALLSGLEQNKLESETTALLTSELGEEWGWEEYSDSRINSIYSQLDFHKKKFQASLALRYIITNFEQQLKMEPRVHLNYYPNKAFSIGFHLGRYQQIIQQLNEEGFTDLGIEETLWVVSDNMGIPAIQNNQANIYINYQKRDWSFFLEFYRKNLEGIVSNSFSYKQASSWEIGDMTIQGVDVTISYTKNAFQTWLGYSSTDADLEFSQLSDSNFPASQDIKHNLTWFLSYRWRGISFSNNMTLRSGKPFSEPLYYELHYDQYAEPVFGELNDQRLPILFQWDATLAYRQELSKQKSSVTVGAAIRNISNRRNPYERFFVRDEDADDIYRKVRIDKNLIGRMLNLFLRIQY